MVIDIEKFLSHHGVKGMKWGVRRKGAKSSGSSGTTRYKKAPVRLSDAELNRRIKRMELEKKYSELSKAKSFDGKKYAQSLMENAGKTATGAVVGGVASFAVQRALAKKFPDAVKKKK